MGGEKTRLFVGFEVGIGKQVWIPVFHMLIAGQTQKSGKTTVLKTLGSQIVARAGYRILIFDTKTNMQEFADFGEEIPICLRETTDSLTLLGLLESVFTRRLPAQYLAALSRLTQNAENFKKVLENAEVMERKSNSPFIKDVCRNIIELLTRLIQQTADKVTAPTLELRYPINRITMNKFPLEAQQMIIKTAFEDAIKNYERVIMILDESSKFIPQKYRSACERAINHFVTQGAISNNYLWMSTQYLATTNKDPIKAMDVKLLGRQSEYNECEHTLEVVPKTMPKITNDTIMNLKLGHFIVVADENVTIAYVCPENADPKECQEVSLGKRRPQDIHYRFSQLLTEDEAKKLVKQHATDKIIYIPTPDPPPEEASPVFPTKQIEVPLPKVEMPQTKLDEPKPKIHKSEATPVVNIELKNVQTKIRVTKIIKQIHVSDEDDRGKIFMLAKEGFFRDKWHPLRNIVDAFEARPWTANDLAIKKELYAMAREGLLATKKGKNREFLYTLNANIEFIEEEKNNV